MRDWQTETDSDYLPEESLDTDETRKAIMDIIDSLPEDRRLCVLMHYFDDMPESVRPQYVGTFHKYMTQVAKDAERARDLLKEEMESAVRYTVPLDVDIHVGETWFEAK